MASAPAPPKNATVLYEGSPSCCAAPGAFFRRTHWLITTDFIEFTIGCCCPHTDTMQLLKVKDLTYHDPCCCSCCATLTIYSQDPTNPILKITGIPNAKEIYHQIRDSVLKKQQGTNVQLNV